MSLFAGCNDGSNMIRDTPSASDIMIIVENTDGHNLLDPDFEGNILGQSITAEYKGKAYEIENEGNSETRALPPPQWVGLRLDHDERSDLYMLRFGEFGNGRDQVFEIYLGDNVTYEVKFDFYVEYEGRGKNYRPRVYRKIRLNGELQSEDSLTVTIVK